ncbi:efflux RND transporter periplasmic adaptor subunit [Endozoicomonas numazuensis]|uniref:efflux RND transporter periplasmic adaptor subunit n=1 Tax=Endozoicomonas numazuensis TaxID=1137799 RepID=UPI00068B70B7|nr:efflux RND transporter periplasmic adaptor subunit [Endozoicomonas numazuensis]
MTRSSKHSFPYLAALLLLCFSPFSLAAGKPAPRVTSVVVQEESIERSLTAIGSLTANQSVDISPQIDGRIVSLKLAEGGKVEQGSTLIKMDDREQSAKVSEARISLKDKKRQLDYMQTLFKRKAVSQDELEAMQAEVDRLRAQLSAEEAILDHYTIEAPFRGTLGFHEVSLGTLINTATVITTLDDLSSMKLTFELPENTLSKIQPGSSIAATTEAWPDVQFSGVIETINPRIDPVNLTFKVRATLGNSDRKLRPGMLMRIDVAGPTTTALVVPARSILFSGHQRFVYVIDDESIVHKREVKTGKTLGNQIAIRSGLDAGEHIVDEGIIKVSDGRQVSLPQEKQVVDTGTKTEKSSESRS